MHLTDEILAPIRDLYGEPVILEWEGEISAREFGIATYNPAPYARRHALHPQRDRLALIRKHPFPPDVWRPPGGGVKEGEDFVEAVLREAFEETGLRVELERYLVETHARFVHDGREARLAHPRLSGDDSRRAHRAARHGRDRRRALGDARGARRPAPGATPGDGLRVLAVPRRAPRRGARRR